MKTKNFFLYALIFVVLSGCSTIYYSHWDCTTYDPSRHSFKIDSANLKKYGKEEVERSIRLGWADGWIVDSIIYFKFYIEREKSTMPIIPIFYRVDYQKKNAKCNFQVSVGNNKIYRSLDSVSYTIYDSLKTVYHKGGYNYNLNISKSRRHELFKTPYTINVQLKETDTVYGDIELFFTDYKNKRIINKIRKIKFKYEGGRYFTSDINS